MEARSWPLSLDLRPHHRGHNKVEEALGLRILGYPEMIFRAFGEWLFVLGVYAVAR